MPALRFFCESPRSKIAKPLFDVLVVYQWTMIGLSFGLVFAKKSARRLGLFMNLVHLKDFYYAYPAIFQNFYSVSNDALVSSLCLPF